MMSFNPSKVIPPWTSKETVIFFFLLLFVAFTAYQSVLTSLDYGKQDDYNVLAHNEEFHFATYENCTTLGRPVYGVLTQIAYYLMDSPAGFLVLRWLGLIFLVATLTILYNLIKRWSLDPFWAVMMTSSVVFITPSQAQVAWAITWLNAVALLGVTCSYLCSVRVIETKRNILRKTLWGLLAVILFTFAFLTYQPSALFYLIPYGLYYLFKGEISFTDFLSKTFVHVVIVLLGTLFSYFALKILYYWGGISPSDRTAINLKVWESLLGFIDKPFRRSFGLFFIEYNLKEGIFLNEIVRGIFSWTVLGIIFLSSCLEVYKREWGSRISFLVVIIGLFPAVSIISILVEEKNYAYRTSFVLMAWTSVLFFWALWNIGRTSSCFKQLATFLGITSLILGWCLSSFQVNRYCYLPQQLELAFLRSEISDKDVSQLKSIYIIETKWGYQPSENWDYEFGASNLAFPWGSKFILFSVLQEFDPGLKFKDKKMHMVRGTEKPKNPDNFDLVIDGRQLKDFKSP